MCRQAGKSFIAAAAVLIGATLLSTPAAAGTQCKSATVSANGWNDSQLASRWSAAAKSAYGAAWSSYSLAKNKRYTSQSFIFETLTTVTANPCRRT